MRDRKFNFTSFAIQLPFEVSSRSLRFGFVVLWRNLKEDGHLIFYYFVNRNSVSVWYPGAPWTLNTPYRSEAGGAEAGTPPSLTSIFWHMFRLRQKHFLIRTLAQQSFWSCDVLLATSGTPIFRLLGRGWRREPPHVKEWVWDGAAAPPRTSRRPNLRVLWRLIWRASWSDKCFILGFSQPAMVEDIEDIED